MGDRSRPRTIRIVLTLLIATFVAYLPALSAGFIWDDNDWLTENPAVTGDDGWASIWTGEARLQYYPMLFSAFRVQHALWGLHPAGYHVVNILLHAATAALLGFLLTRLELRGAWWIALAFALHPMHVESVVWVTELKNVLSGAFVVGSLLVFTQVIQAPRFDRVRYGLALALFVAAVLSKTAVATAVLVLPILCFRTRGRFRASDLKAAVPFAAVGVALGWVAVRLEQGLAAAVGADFDFTWIERLLIGSRALFFYPSKLIVPHPLIFNYPRWDLSTWEAWIWPPLALATALLVGVAWRRGHRGTVSALAVYVLMIAPALGLFNVYAFRYSFVADHFAYLASIGCLVLVVEFLVRRLPGQPRQRFVIGTGLLLTLAVLTWNQTHAYRDRTTLWSHTIRHNPDSWLAHHSLALEALGGDRPEVAAVHFEQALRCKPASVESLTGRAMLRARQDDLDAALADLDRALELASEYPQARLHRGLVRNRSGQWDGALDDLDLFLAANPGNIEALGARAEAYSRLDRFPEGIADLDAALAAGGPPEMLVERGFVRIGAGDLGGAARDAELAKAIDAVAGRGWELEGVVWFRRGDLETACRSLRRACDFGRCRVWEAQCTLQPDNGHILNLSEGSPRP
ncbi:MAG: tetratricopeptide repeat protein [Acidobacteria bacterium]|nr:tetratricopeptide repeat protein [Acidobacteriota bacterium]